MTQHRPPFPILPKKPTEHSPTMLWSQWQKEPPEKTPNTYHSTPNYYATVPETHRKLLFTKTESQTNVLPGCIKTLLTILRIMTNPTNTYGTIKCAIATHGTTFFQQVQQLALGNKHQFRMDFSFWPTSNHAEAAWERETAGSIPDKVME